MSLGNPLTINFLNKADPNPPIIHTIPPQPNHHNNEHLKSTLYSYPQPPTPNPHPEHAYAPSASSAQASRAPQQKVSATLSKDSTTGRTTAGRSSPIPTVATSKNGRI
ncbi:hypothetical protein BO83DRAFT_385449 [Aspergillus eucalypticola CBS 122712]|uniref:Uncharacterized protein n=1 Tax=Aspergillus eucalypticola (strain CBS 122712 / IBT 29274) TaxID=1448314 RepID=A0A317W3E5_ASPEC|nr:uncharacterized protein BO83DRAFT_385449 [Aspergillus eucalypticola CBS 122712]PWY81023.1 hypothetical protein BO83DRAFT_385449 [Aspergillus eucalypticola CBS 122712]